MEYMKRFSLVFEFQEHILKKEALPYVLGVTALGFTSLLWTRSNRRGKHRLLEYKAKSKRSLRDQGIEGWKPQLEITKEEKERIIEMTASELLREMEQGSLTSEKIMTAFCIQAKEVGFGLNAIAEEFFEEAIQQAKAADERRKKKDPQDPPKKLDGLPISVKDQVNQKGADSTCGLSVRCFQPSEVDGLMLSILREAGCIPFIRSNIPQCLMLPESDCAIWGRAQNPWNPSRTPGGSSGGEAALVASRCSPLGVGTDIGGSVRIPCHFCGLTGFKPTPQRLSLLGVSTSSGREGVSGQEAIRPSLGVLARSVDDLVLLFETWLSENMWEKDPLIPPTPFRHELYSPSSSTSSPLRIGYLLDDDWFTPSAACSRAVTETKEALEKQGHTLVPFDPETSSGGLFSFRDVVLTFFGIISADGTRMYRQALEGEEIHPSYRQMFAMALLPSFLRSFLSSLLQTTGEERASSLVASTAPKSSFEYWSLLARRTKLLRAFFDAWKKEKLDAIICPASALPALPHGASRDLGPAFSYTFVFNVLSTPAGVVPVTTVQPSETIYPTSSSCSSSGSSSPTGPTKEKKKKEDLYTKRAAEAMKGAEGLPVGVQVVTLPYQDEVCLRVMKNIQDAIKFEAKPKIH